VPWPRLRLIGQERGVVGGDSLEEGVNDILDEGGRDRGVAEQGPVVNHWRQEVQDDVRIDVLAQVAAGGGPVEYGSTEHHFQTEGGESIPNSLLLYAKLAALTDQIMFAPLSVVLAAQDPIRVAENIALLTHMFPGRIGVGFARGYQTRWLQTLSQDDNIAALNPASDARNREIFNEYLKVVETAWAEDSFNFKGAHYQAPYPATGIPNWPLAEWTRAYGHPDDVDAEGTVHQIGILPKPLTRPTIFIPSTTSDQTVIDSARHGRTLLISAGNRERTRYVTKLYLDSARKAGHDLEMGDRIGVVAKVTLGESYDEAFDLASRTSSFWHQNFFGKFYFNEAFRTTPDDLHRPVHFADERGLTQRMFEQGQLFLGTLDMVIDQMRDVMGLYGGGKLDWFCWEYWNQSLPGAEGADVQQYQLQTYAEKIMPVFA
jgi:alkanesulfonate monooxygenase SsuD/methylene tetrahydromethanopterin reductase-like flavin-dependent oxidoreductase (luciferase family)